MAIEQRLDSLWNYNQPAESEILFRKLLAEAVDGNARAEILTQLARAQGLQSKFDEAHKTLDEITTLPKDDRIQVRYLLERGRPFNSAHEPDKAKSLFLEAYRLAKSIKADFYCIDAAHMLAIIETPEKQLEWHEVCFELCNETTDERAKKWLWSVSNNLGWTYHDLGKFEAALEAFQKALEWQEVNGKPENIRIAKWSIARTLRSLRRYQEALDIQQNLLEEDSTDGYVHEEIAECLLALKQDNLAKASFAKAYELLSQDTWFANNQRARLERLKKLSL
jgi:tetratricopeptide (TPR) repeat protein